jgi:tetratricopeptide (TPR) repeat protein
MVVEEHLLVADFSTQHIYKGEQSPTQVETRTEADACGVALKPGSRYLVYAHGPDETGRIFTGRCLRTALAEESTQDIEILNAVTMPASALLHPAAPELRFNEALDLIHSGTSEGKDEELSQAMMIAEELAGSEPLSGFSQALQAEILSIFLLAEYNEDIELQQQVFGLTDEALRINPNLAQAHVARARAYANSRKFMEAEEAIQTAFRIQPQLPSAIFVQADIYRLSNHSMPAWNWIRSFIAVVKQPAKKANAYQWLGNMWRDYAYHPEAVNREMHLTMAKVAYRSSIDLGPNDAWRLINFAVFLNEYPADFAGAESYAVKALAIQESPMARYHLAAARYQALQAKAAAIDAQALRESIAEIGASTAISLDEAVDYPGFRDVINVRLTRLQRRAQSTDR